MSVAKPFKSIAFAGIVLLCVGIIIVTLSLSVHSIQVPWDNALVHYLLINFWTHNLETLIFGATLILAGIAIIVGTVGL